MPFNELLLKVIVARLVKP